MTVFNTQLTTNPDTQPQGVEVELFDENGAPQPPPILDPHTPPLPGNCTQGSLTEAGYGMVGGALARDAVSRGVQMPYDGAGF